MLPIEARGQIRPNCEFCSIPETRGTDLFRQLYDVDQVITSIPVDRSMTLMQDVVPLGEGGVHVLLLPKQVGKGHYISLASSDNPEAISNSTEQTIKSIQKAFPNKPLFLFEHGSGFVEGEQITCGGCHMDHAHGHIIALPNNTRLSPIVEALEGVFKTAGGDDLVAQKQADKILFDNIGSITGINPYIHIAMVDGNQRSSITYTQTSRSPNIESQLLRRITAKVVYNESNSTYWHWRDITAGFTSKQRLNELKENVRFFSAIFRS